MNSCVNNNIIFSENEERINIEGGVGKALFDSMKKNLPKTIQIDARTGNKDTYETLLTKCIRISIHLQKLGVSRDDIVSLCSDTNLDACIPLIATQFIGAMYYAFEPDQPAQDIATVMKQIPPKVFFITPELFGKITEATKIANVTTKVITFEDLSFREILNTQLDEEKMFAPVYIHNLKETAFLNSTSGSTGVPKIMQQSHYSSLAALYGHAKAMGCYRKGEEQEVLFIESNWYWEVTTRLVYMAILHGACWVWPISVRGEVLLHYIEKCKASNVFTEPRMLHELSMLGDLISKRDTSHLKSISTAGAAVHRGYIEKLRKLLPHVAIFALYGQSETGFCTFFDYTNERHKVFMATKPTSVGVPLPGLEFRVVNPETEEILGTNQKGEIRIKTNVLVTYLNADISESLDQDGFYKTGDVGFYDEDLCVFIVDRIKNQFKYQLWHVSPGYLEDVIIAHPAVAQVVVVGKPHELDESHPKALIVLKEYAAGLLPKDIEKFVEERVDDRLRLRAGVTFLKSFPLTPSGKVDRVALRKLVETGEI